MKNVKNIKIIFSIICVITIFSSFNICYGTSPSDTTSKNETSLLDTIFGKGNTWFNNSKNNDEGSDKLGEDIKTYINGNIVPLIGAIGNLAFFIIAAFLGVKYIWSGVSGKSEVKETLPTFVIGAMFFYTADTIYKFSTNQFVTITNATGFEAISGSIWLTVTVIIQILSIAGIIAIGLKYMFSAADTKADIKKDLLPMVIGLVIIYALSEVLPFIEKISDEMFK
ncbi:MAG: hypothetical protein RR144_03825 [Clostridia bacterium]